MLSLPALVALFLAGALGGAINAVAGGGSLVVFPALLLLGVPPVAANATAATGLWPAGIASSVAYRSALAGVPRSLLAALAVVSAAGGGAGAILLLRTNDASFLFIVPWLVLFATVVLSAGPDVASRVSAMRAPRALAFVAQLAIAVYGGYFGGGMGILMLAAFTALLGMKDLHAMNGVKTILSVFINGAAVALFVASGKVAWPEALAVAIGSLAGGYAGARLARVVAPAKVRRVVLAMAWCLTGWFFYRVFLR
jgi:uncharacterized membrane protein YfcA